MKIEWIKKVYSDGNHNAFTAISYFDNHYYLAFRNARGHLSTESTQIIMRSQDGENWNIAEENSFPSTNEATIDYRDSSFLRTDDELRLYSFCSLSINGECQNHYSQVQTLNKGARKWSSPLTIKNGSILWKPRKIDDEYYVLGYHRNHNGYKCNLYYSGEGIVWKNFGYAMNGSEADLLKKTDDNLLAFARTEAEPYMMEIFEAEPPYKDWTLIHKTEQIIQCPHLFEANEKVYLIGRYRPDYMRTADKNNPSFAQHRTKIWEFANNQLIEVIELPGAGDCSYPSTVFTPDGSLLVSYYSQRETSAGFIWGDNMTTDIFITKININN
jgi:hypothetical protein